MFTTGYNMTKSNICLVVSKAGAGLGVALRLPSPLEGLTKLTLFLLFVNLVNKSSVFFKIYGCFTLLY